MVRLGVEHSVSCQQVLYVGSLGEEQKACLRKGTTTLAAIPRRLELLHMVGKDLEMSERGSIVMIITDEINSSTVRFIHFTFFISS